MRRLPIFLVLDVSESMAGDNIRNVTQGIEALARKLRQDPHALETVCLSVIVFAGKARVITPLVELPSFISPRLPIGSGTSLGAALDTLMSEIERNVVKSTVETKGDWKAIVYLLTDGKPTDDCGASIDRWKDQYANKATLIAVGVGKHADMTILSKLSEHTYQLRNGNSDDIAKFVQWLSQSVSSQSQSVALHETGGISLAKIDESVMTKITATSPIASVDEDFVIITGRCESSKHPYIIRYERLPEIVIETQDFKTSAQRYQMNAVFPLEDDYFDLSDERVVDQTVNSDALVGSPGCPHCGARIGLAMCACGHIHCLSKPQAICPWCGQEGIYTAVGDEGGFDVVRSRG